MVIVMYDRGSWLQVWRKYMWLINLVIKTLAGGNIVCECVCLKFAEQITYPAAEPAIRRDETAEGRCYA